jgi:hypothetical protein
VGLAGPGAAATTGITGPDATGTGTTGDVAGERAATGSPVRTDKP